MLMSKMSRIFPEGEDRSGVCFFGLGVFIAAILIGLWLSLKPNALQNKYEAYQPTNDGHRVRVEVGGTLLPFPRITPVRRKRGRKRRRILSNCTRSCLTSNPMRANATRSFCELMRLPRW